jgi:hypothetical protein
MPTAVVMKGCAMWDITPCSPLKINRCLEGTSIFGVEDYAKQQTTGKCDFFLDPENGGGVFLQNV